MKTLDIIVPFYNEEECIEKLLTRLLALKEVLSETLDVNFILVDDGSSDKSVLLVNNYAEKHKCIKLITFTRNFGQDIAVTAGLDYSSSDYVAIIDSDLQDPPELIPAMYEKLAEGYDIVYAKRIERKSETLFKKLTAYGFYRVINLLSEIKMPPDTGNFRIMTAKVRKTVNAMKEHQRFLRGLIAWSGFKSVPYYYNRDEREAGKTKYSALKMFKLALTGIFSLSYRLLDLVWGIAGLLIILSFVAAIYNPVISAILFCSALQIAAIGLVGMYIAGISQDTKARPLYVIDKVINLN